MHVNFFAVAEDMKHLMRLCEEQKLMVLPVSYALGQEPVPEPAISYEIGESAFCLVPREFSLDDVIYIEGQKHKRGTALLDREASPVIVCDPPVVWGTKLDGGSLDVAGEASGHKFTLIERRYDALHRHIKRWARTDKNQGYVAPAAERLVKEKRLQLGLGKRSVELW